jgi:hypothetical protein
MAAGRRTARRLATTAAAACALAAVAPVGAGAAIISVRGDDGNPIAVPAQGGLNVRQMDQRVTLGFATNERYYSLQVTGPDGAAVRSPLDCFIASGNESWSFDFRGNGAYAVAVQTYSASGCAPATLVANQRVTFAITSFSGITAPPGPVLTRRPGETGLIEYQLPVSLNPGAFSHEVRFAPGGVIGPDGSISGPSEQAFVDSNTGTAAFRFKGPGTYTVIARARRSGDFGSPWSTPVAVRAIAPFDLKTLRFPDSRGPRYRLRARIREETIRGRVVIAIARGRKSGRYRFLGSVRITTDATFSKRFRLRRSGTYRVRFRFKGSDTVAPGVIVQRFRISRRIFLG